MEIVDCPIILSAIYPTSILEKRLIESSFLSVLGLTGAGKSSVGSILQILLVTFSATFT
jgi:ABC-type uncharacterized transport system ATPase component